MSDGRANFSDNWRVRSTGPQLEIKGLVDRRTATFERRGNQANNATQTFGKPKTYTEQLAPPNRFYVGNLDYVVQREDILQFFNEHGFTISSTDVHLSIDPMTGRNPSYGFIDTASEEEAERAVRDINGIVLHGRPLKINWKTPRRIYEGPPDLRVKVPGRGWSAVRLDQTPSEYTKPAFDRYSEGAPDHWYAPIEEGRRLYIGGLPRMEPQTAVDAALQGLLAENKLPKPQVVSKIISPRIVGDVIKPIPDLFYLFVDFENAEQAEGVIQCLDGSLSPWGKGRLKVSKARAGENRKVVREQGSQKQPK